MKNKFFISLNSIILLIFCTINFCCAEDFFLNGKFEESAEQKVNTVSENNSNNVSKKEKKGLFGIFKGRKEIKNKEQKATDLDKRGYYGNLPNIYSDFKYKKTTPSTPQDTDYKIPTVEELDAEEFKPAPFEDTLFLDNVVKKEKDSDYVNSIQRTKFAFTKLKEALEQETNIQRINASINMVDLYVSNLEKKYENSSEKFRESYKDMINTDYQAKLFGNLLYDSDYYARMIPVSNSQYSKENIEAKKRTLLNKVNKTIFLLNQET